MVRDETPGCGGLTGHLTQAAMTSPRGRRGAKPLQVRAMRIAGSTSCWRRNGSRTPKDRHGNGNFLARFALMATIGLTSPGWCGHTADRCGSVADSGSALGASSDSRDVGGTAAS